MNTKFLAFLQDEDGAITVDWVVLTGLVCLLCLTIIALIGGASTDLGQRLSDAMALVLP